MPKQIPIPISVVELKRAAVGGIQRQIQSWQETGGPKYGMKTDQHGWHSNIIGCIGEYALAKHLGVPWTPNLGEWKAHDVGGYYEVRATPLSYENGKLRCHDDDKMDSPYILARTGMDKVLLAGWLWAREVVHKENLSDPFKWGKPAYFVDMFKLRDMETLPELR